MSYGPVLLFLVLIPWFTEVRQMFLSNMDFYFLHKTGFLFIKTFVMFPLKNNDIN